MLVFTNSKDCQRWQSFFYAQNGLYITIFSLFKSNNIYSNIPSIILYMKLFMTNRSINQLTTQKKGEIIMKRNCNGYCDSCSTEKFNPCQEEGLKPQKLVTEEITYVELKDLNLSAEDLHKIAAFTGWDIAEMLNYYVDENWHVEDTEEDMLQWRNKECELSDFIEAIANINIADLIKYDTIAEAFNANDCIHILVAGDKKVLYLGE